MKVTVIWRIVRTSKKNPGYAPDYTMFLLSSADQNPLHVKDNKILSKLLVTEQ